jgi:predicted small metal-binding protein
LTLIAALNSKAALMKSVASMNMCSCGWTIISPLGADDVKMHTVIHLKNAHPGTAMSEAEIMEHIKTI